MSALWGLHSIHLRRGVVAVCERYGRCLRAECGNFDFSNKGIKDRIYLLV